MDDLFLIGDILIYELRTDLQKSQSVKNYLDQTCSGEMATRCPYELVLIYICL